MKTLAELRKELRDVEAELNNQEKPRHLSQDDIEDVSDNYQENLEYGWWLDEQEAMIKQLKKDIKIAEAVAINTPKPKYQKFMISSKAKQPYTEQEMRNIERYKALPAGPIHSSHQTCYPANYDGELDDIQLSAQDWSDLADEHDKLRSHGKQR
jgi:hypothetical protein